MNKQTLSDNACYARPNTTVPFCFNNHMNRLEIEIKARTDVTHCVVHLYERQGIYWFSFLVDSSKIMNSVGFVSLRNCVASLRDVLRGLGFVLSDGDGLTRFVRAWERGREVA